MAKASLKYHQINVPFSLIATNIDFFQLDNIYFSADFNVKKNLSKLSPGQYFSLGTNFNFNDKETVVFNFQVGQGKTTLCYDLIEQYERKGYCVVVCSPFVKLVRKDYEELKARIEKKSVSGLVKGMIPKVFKYDDVDSLSHWGERMKDIAAHSRNVHIMTINCLLGNSGSNSYEQAFSKQDYLKDLIKVAKSRNQKVVFFIDEVHESVANFSSLFIPNLLKWNGIVEKVFIASATFTPATVPIIKAFSLLTDKNINIFETERIKNKLQADIHLHICDTPAFPKSQFEEIIKQQIRIYQKKKKDINIITGIKTTAENIASSTELFTKINKSELRVGKFFVNEINLLSGDTEISYQKGQNNIGTTFKTGVNITGITDVLFVVFPNLSKNAVSDSYGTFADGITSIIQSIGRLRNGGELHLFINEPAGLIGDPNDYDVMFKDRVFVSHIPVNNLYQELLAKYRFDIAERRIEIAEMERGLLNSQNISVEKQKEQFGFYYPNEQEFILLNGQNLALRHDNFSFGRLLAPFIMWACINNQFTNGTLKVITRYTRSTVSLNKINALTVFNNILSQHVSAINSLGFRESIQSVGKFLSECVNQNGELETINFEIDGKLVPVGDIISRNPSYLNELAKTAYHLCAGTSFPSTKEEYINACINEARNKVVGTSTILRKAYSEFGRLKAEFLDRVRAEIRSENGKDYILLDSGSVINDDLFQKFVSLIEKLKERDSLLRYKAFSFMQDNVTGTAKKHRLFKLLKELFLDVGNKKQIGNEVFIEVKSIDPMANLSFLGML